LNEAGYSRFFARLESDYVAEDKFWIFGGSETKTTISTENNNYNNFAAGDAQNISVLDLNGSIFTDGSYEGYIFKLKGGVRSLSLITDIEESGTDLGLNGYALVEGTGDLANFGAETELSLNTYETGEYLRFSGGIVWDLFGKDFTLNSRLGAVFVEPTVGEGIIWPQAKVNLNLPLGRVFTVQATGRTGVNNNTFADMISQNPYLNGQSEVLFTKNIFGGDVVMRHHPATKFGFMLGGGFDAYEDYQFFTDAAEATFMATYADAQIARGFFEGYWTPTDEDKLTGNITYNYGLLSGDDILGDDLSVPYLPDFQIEFDYQKTLFDFLVISPEIAYISQRFADLANEDELPGYVDLRFMADAELGSGLVLNFEARNLLDSNVYVWNGYRARGLFFNGGATWRF
jgi:hypothetical protein